MEQVNFAELSCSQCLNLEGLDFDFSYAYQPIVDVEVGDIVAYEALVRGLNGESAYSVLSKVNPDNRYRFDQACRVKAVRLAAELNLDKLLSINFMPNAVYRPELCIRTTLEAAAIYDFPVNQIVFELTEGEKIASHEHIGNIIKTYQELGFRVAIDDFGSGYSGLNLLSEFQTDILKLDMVLIRNIHESNARQAIVRGVMSMCAELEITIIAEGVETVEEYHWLRDAGIHWFQGYYFAKPGFECLPAVEVAC